MTRKAAVTWQCLPQRHSRPYLSIFGAFTLARTVHGSRAGQKSAFVPLDNRLQLPASRHLVKGLQFSIPT